MFGVSRAADITYKAIFCLFVILGSAISAQSVFDFGDAMIFAMCFPNVLGLYFLMRSRLSCTPRLISCSVARKAQNCLACTFRR